MTTRAASFGRWQGRHPGGVMPPLRQRMEPALRAFMPSFQWVTFLLILGVVISVVWSLQAARWTTTPPLHLAVFLGLAVGAALARAPINVWVLQSVALTLWLLTILWMFIAFLNAPGGFAGIYHLGERFGQWFYAARTGGISTDALPFAVTLTVLTWVLGYAVGWLTFRRRSVWLPLVLAGLALLTNLSYLPKSYYSYFYLYLFFALLAVAWTGFMERRRAWDRQRISHSATLAAYGLSDALWFGLAAIIIALLLPSGFPRPPIFKKAYEVMRWPVESYSGDFSRLFAGVPAKKAVPYRTFDDTLAFQGTIKLGDQVIFAAQSTLPTYFRMRSYPIYISQGWIAGDTQLVPVDWTPGESSEALYLERLPVLQGVKLQYSPRLLPMGGQVEESDRALLAEVPVSPTFTIPLVNAPIDPRLPAEVRLFTRNLRRTPLSSLTDARIKALLPEGFELLAVHRSEAGVVVTVSTRRVIPPALEVLSVQSATRLLTEDTYVARTSVSIATPEELRGAGERYPTWVRDLYLQLPDTLPQRVRDLAQRLTVGADTPYDKAMAIQSYLKTVRYSQAIPPPGYNADGVDHFLFVAQAGYSEYYGSAMAVMLRVVGVPARLAVGYTYDEPDANGVVLVRDLNAHGWAEVFFPNYGWVDFEPTPGRELPGPELLSQEDLYIEGLGEDDPFSEFEGDESELPPLGSRDGGDIQGGILLGLSVRLWLALATSLVAIFLVLRAGLRWLMGTPSQASAVYRKLTRLTALAGLGPAAGQTPREFGLSLGHRLPDLRPAFATVVDAYGRGRYGQKNLTLEEERVVGVAWRQVRLPLLGQALGRLGWPRRAAVPR
ncbi:MAG: transglutaminase domain-containing protein [Chloroflexi bacterium]|nr:transglutaminase domain-containing protein [Chloroflexota bacterium]